MPAYSPELNRIEPVFRQVKYQEIPVRSYTSKTSLRQAVEHGFDSYTGKLRQKSAKKTEASRLVPFVSSDRRARI